MLISDLLNDAMKRAGVADSVRAAIVVDASNKALVSVFGEGVLLMAKTGYVQNSELVIYCSNASLGDEICLRGEKILDCIFKLAPDAKISRVRLMHKSRENIESENAK